jgi:signal transduction histidine kinase
MRLAQTVRSAAFRLTAAYVLLFTVSVGLLAALTYFLVVSRLDLEFRNHIRADTHTLSAEFAAGGPKQLLRAISERQHNRTAGGLYYSVLDSNGLALTGTAERHSCEAGWFEVVGPPDGDEPSGEMERLAVFATPLRQGYCLMVGDDYGKVRGVGTLVLRTFGWVFLITLTLAVAGGLLLSSRFLKRIDIINRTAEAIIEGDIRQRIPRRAAPDDLDRLAATLNRMLDRTNDLMDSLRHVTSDIAHDLRTPLGRLRNQLEDAKAHAGTPEEFRAAAEEAIAEVDGLLSTFSAILRIAQIEGGSRRAGFKAFSLSRLVEDVCESFADAVEDASKRLTAEVAPNLAVNGDQELLVQALVNLIENAIAYTPQGSVIAVGLQRCEGRICLSVADNGPGVPETDLERIFQRFVRLEPSRSTAGNGLGLSIVAAVAELHGGAARASDNHPGLRIALTLPAA